MGESQYYRLFVFRNHVRGGLWELNLDLYNFKLLFLCKK